MAGYYKIIAGTVDGGDKDGLAEAIKSTSNALHMTETADYMQVSSNTVVKSGPPAIYYGVVVINPGTLGTVRVFDGVNASGVQILPTMTSLVAGLYLPSSMPGVSIRCKTGIYVECGGTVPPTINVLYL